MPGGGIPEVGLGRPTMAFHGFRPSSLFTEVTSSWCSVTCQNSIVVLSTVFNDRSGPDMYPKFTPTRSPRHSPRAARPLDPGCRLGSMVHTRLPARSQTATRQRLGRYRRRPENREPDQAERVFHSMH